MVLPDYWLTRPPMGLDDQTQLAFEALYRDALKAGGCPTIDFGQPRIKWQFLCYLGDQLGLALHGSGNPDIAVFEPRQPNDLTEFGNQRAVYAAADGLWAMFFPSLIATELAQSRMPVSAWKKPVRCAAPITCFR